MEEQERAYYAVIPANVRYDEDLPANAKLLYGEITALCHEKGFCWASNRYFAALYHVSTVSISKWVSALAKAGHITIEMVNKGDESKEVVRRIWITTAPLNKSLSPHKEKFNTPLNKSLSPHKEKFMENITDNTTGNNTKNNNKGARALVADYTSDTELADALNGLFEARKAMRKPNTDHAVKLLLAKLDKLTDYTWEKVLIVNQSIERGWVSVFPLKNDDRGVGDDKPVFNRFTEAMRAKGITSD